MKFKIGDKVKGERSTIMITGTIFNICNNPSQRGYELIQVAVPKGQGWGCDSLGTRPPKGFDGWNFGELELTLVEEEKDMKFLKTDLKSGMLIETKVGNTYILLRSSDGYLHAVRENSYIRLCDIDDDLKCTANPSHDIMKVWGVPDSRTLESILEDKGPLLYERIKKKKYLVLHSFYDTVPVKQGEILTLIQEFEPNLYNNYATSEGIVVETDLANLIEMEEE